MKQRADGKLAESTHCGLGGAAKKNTGDSRQFRKGDARGFGSDGCSSHVVAGFLKRKISVSALRRVVDPVTNPAPVFDIFSPFQSFLLPDPHLGCTLSTLPVPSVCSLCTGIVRTIDTMKERGQKQSHSDSVREGPFQFQFKEYAKILDTKVN